MRLTSEHRTRHRPMACHWPKHGVLRGAEQNIPVVKVAILGRGQIMTNSLNEFVRKVEMEPIAEMEAEPRPSLESSFRLFALLKVGGSEWGSNPPATSQDAARRF